MTGSHIRAVAFDCFGTLLHIGAPTNPWRSLLSEAHRQPGGHMLDPRREPIPTIEAFAAACGTKFRPEWRRDLDRELASIELVPEALAVLGRLRAAGFLFALASNLAWLSVASGPRPGCSSTSTGTNSYEFVIADNSEPMANTNARSPPATLSCAGRSTHGSASASYSTFDAFERKASPAASSVTPPMRSSLITRLPGHNITAPVAVAAGVAITL